ncbi:alpha/beta fold hydrolase [Chloroflexota bacterium]
MKAKNLLKIAGGMTAVIILVLVAAYLYLDSETIILNDEVRSGLVGQFVELSNGTVHYELAGSDRAPTVVMVHGFSVPYYVWDPTFDALVDEGFRVLRYDLYGRGYSDRPNVDYNLDLFTGQLEELLFTLDIEGPVSLVGMSFGGPVVTAFANQHPDQVRGLVLIDPQVSAVSNADIFPMNIPVVGEIIMALYVVPVMLPKSQTSDFYRPESFQNWEDAYRDQMQYSGFRSALLSSMRNMIEADPLTEYETLAKAEYPVVLFWGREDQTINTSDITILREILPDLQFHPIDEAGHLPHYEKPEVVNPLLFEFLSNLE